MGYKEKYLEWCANPIFDAETREELKQIVESDTEIRDRFYKDLEFGTGGLRGVIGNGTNRMNIYTVRKATQGLANYICQQNGQAKGVAIAFDSRKMSPEFADEAALCLNANGIKAYVFPELRPTPELSFAVRRLGCIAGIVITASHNPPEYNGYKVYWEDGAQITAPKDKEIITEVHKIEDYGTVKTMNKNEAIEKDLYVIIDESIDDDYILELKKQSVCMDATKEIGKDFTIVYTPLHGAGNLPVRRILKELGFEDICVVPEQELPDPEFSTVKYPNPEDPNAFTLALKLAKEKNADIVLATDPDADRLGIYAKDTESGDYVPFTGNMSGMLIAEYILSNKRQRGELPKNGVLVKTIVTTDMAKEIAKEYNVKLIEVLTGFKYIGEQIKIFEENKSYEYIFGLEESYGCLAGTYARDKDAVVAVMLLCEAAAYYKINGLSLVDQMRNIYKKYGYFKEGLNAITLKGVEGVERIKEITSKLRNEIPEKIGKYEVVVCRDYNTGECLELSTGKKSKIELPKANVLYYELQDNAWCCVRPSGTEPKIKCYFGIKGESDTDAEKKIAELSDALLDLIKNC